jgi:hypothetical protein
MDQNAGINDPNIKINKKKKIRKLKRRFLFAFFVHGKDIIINDVQCLGRLKAIKTIKFSVRDP